MVPLCARLEAQVEGSEISESGGVVKFLEDLSEGMVMGLCGQQARSTKEILTRECGLEHAYSVETPLGEIDKERGKCEAMAPEKATRIRRVMARLNYMSQDRVDIATAANVISRWRSKPRQCGEVVLNRCISFFSLAILNVRFSFNDRRCLHV